MKKTLAWIPMLLGALVFHGLAEMPPPPAGELAAPSARKVCAAGAVKPAPVLHYTFGQSAKSVRVKDRSGHGNDGMAVRPLRRVPGIVKGQWAARFNGISDYIRVPRSASLEPEELTVAAWVRIPDGIEPADAGAIIFKRNTSFHDNEGYNMEILPDRRVRMTIGHCGGQKNVISREALAPDLWHHVAMTFLGGRMRLYVDGKPAGEEHFIQALDHNPSADLLIGGRDHASHPMDRFAWFDLADVRIWSKALDMHQIAALYGEFADRPKVAHPADNQSIEPSSRNADHTFICGTPSLPTSQPIALDVPAIRRDALVLHYAFVSPKDGTELRDRSGHQTNGTALKPLEWVRGPGNLEGALRFDGVEDCIRVPRSSSLEPEAITVAAWVKLDASRPMTKPGGTVVFKRNPSFYNNEDYQLEICSNRTVKAVCANPSGVQTKVVSPNPIAPDLWHHLAMSVGRGRIRLYVDGQSVADTPCTHPLNHNPEADLFIGAKDHVLDHPCPMSLADVRIWSAVLDESEIAALYREKALFSDVAKPGMKRPPEPPRVFPPWQPPEKKVGEGTLATELRALLEQGRRDRAASPEFLDALQRTLDRHAGGPVRSCGCCPMAPSMPASSAMPNRGR